MDESRKETFAAALRRALPSVQPAPWTVRQVPGDEWWFGAGDEVTIRHPAADDNPVAVMGADPESVAAFNLIVQLRNAAPEIAAVLEACARAECFSPDESAEGAYRCGNCDGCLIRAALEDLNAKVEL